VYINLNTDLTKGNDVDANLPHAASLTLPLHKGEDVSLTHGALDVSDDGTVGIVEELNTHLDGVTGVAGTADDLVHLGELGVSGRILRKKKEGKID
jgi:hypothetical protein